MTWDVYRYDFNSNKIELFNVFRHGRFREDTQKALRDSKNKAEFALIIKRELRYYFWSKSEYELIVRLSDDNRVFLLPWCGSKDPEYEKIEMTDDYWQDFAKLHINHQIYTNEAKIDIYDQVMFKWDKFIDYCWNFKE